MRTMTERAIDENDGNCVRPLIQIMVKCKYNPDVAQLTNVTNELLLIQIILCA